MIGYRRTQQADVLDDQLAFHRRAYFNCHGLLASSCEKLNIQHDILKSLRDAFAALKV